MRKRRLRGRAKTQWAAMIAIAFGVGLLLSLLCSGRFALFVAAILLVYLGATLRC